MSEAVTGSGGCACRSVRYHTKASGFVLDQADRLEWYEPAAGVFYGFCGRCGSTMFWRADGVADWVSICTGTLDQPIALTTSSAWWVADAADYHRLDGELDQHNRETT